MATDFTAATFVVDRKVQVGSEKRGCHHNHFVRLLAEQFLLTSIKFLNENVL